MLFISQITSTEQVFLPSSYSQWFFPSLHNFVVQDKKMNNLVAVITLEYKL